MAHHTLYLVFIFHVSILIFFQLPPWKGFAEHTVHALCLLSFIHSQMQGISWRPLQIFSGTSSYTKPSPETLKLLVFASTALCVTGLVHHGSHTTIHCRMSVHLKDSWRETVPVHLLGIHASTDSVCLRQNAIQYLKYKAFLACAKSNIWLFKSRILYVTSDFTPWGWKKNPLFWTLSIFMQNCMALWLERDLLPMLRPWLHAVSVKLYPCLQE